jgi:hypothetical protein
MRGLEEGAGLSDRVGDLVIGHFENFRDFDRQLPRKPVASSDARVELGEDVAGGEGLMNVAGLGEVGEKRARDVSVIFEITDHGEKKRVAKLVHGSVLA